jgi:hypothetical protein
MVKRYGKSGFVCDYAETRKQSQFLKAVHRMPYGKYRSQNSEDRKRLKSSGFTVVKKNSRRGRILRYVCLYAVHT